MAASRPGDAHASDRHRHERTADRGNRHRMRNLGAPCGFGRLAHVHGMGHVCRLDVPPRPGRQDDGAGRFRSTALAGGDRSMSTARLAVIVMLLASTALLARASHGLDNAANANLSTLPYAVSDWKGTEGKPLDEETLRVLGADAYMNRTYVEGAGAPVGLYIAYYAAPRPGVSVHSPLHCLPGTGWEPLDVGTVAVASNEVRRLVVRKNRDRALVLYWYAMRGRVVSSEAMSKLWLLHDSLRYGRRDAALVRIVVPIAGSVDEAERRGIAFTRDLLPYLSQLWS